MVGDDGDLQTHRLLLGGLCVNQGGGFICSMRWHPDEDAVYVDVSGNERRLTMKRTSKLNGKQALVQGDFDSDEEGPDWMDWRVTNPRPRRRDLALLDRRVGAEDEKEVARSRRSRC